jgi:hypothetical protein
MAQHGAALKRGIANDEIGRPKSLCICARYQRPVVESSFCEIRTWLVLRSRCQPLHSGRLWRLRSSPATVEAAAVGCASRLANGAQISNRRGATSSRQVCRAQRIITPLTKEDQTIFVSDLTKNLQYAAPSYWMRRGVCFKISVCDQRLATRRKY